MKRIPFNRSSLVFSVIILLALSACVRPIPRDDVPESPEVAPTTDLLIIPTAPPVVDDAGTGAPADSTAPATDSSSTEGTASEGTEATGETPTDATAETPTDQTVVEAGGEVIHVVQAGDTLGHIAEQYGVSIQDIAAANGIVNVDSLDVGQELIIKAGAAAESSGESTPETNEAGEQIHVVKAGENLFRIGLQYGFTPEELAAYNNILDMTRIDVGQIIKIPPK